MRVAVIDDYQEAALAFADWSGLDVDSFADHVAGRELAARLAPYEVVVATRERTRFDRALIEQLPALRLLVSTGVGTGHLDIGALRARGVVVSGTPVSSASTGELTWALVLGLVRHLPAEDRDVRAGRFGRRVGLDLAGSTLGLIGLGRLGSQVAAIGLAFGMDVQAWSANLDPDRAGGMGVRAVGFEELLSTSAVVSVHTRLSGRTRGLVGARELALMRPEAYLVNTSRGPIVDEEALCEALTAGRLAGAALDVYDQEPLPPTSRLLAAPNTLLTPHIGYVSASTYRMFYVGAVDAIRAWQAGSPIVVLG